MKKELADSGYANANVNDIDSKFNVKGMTKDSFLNVVDKIHQKVKSNKSIGKIKDKGLTEALSERDGEYGDYRTRE